MLDSSYVFRDVIALCRCPVTRATASAKLVRECRSSRLCRRWLLRDMQTSNVEATACTNPSTSSSMKLRALGASDSFSTSGVDATLSGRALENVSVPSCGIVAPTLWHPEIFADGLWHFGRAADRQTTLSRSCTATMCCNGRCHRPACCSVLFGSGRCSSPKADVVLQ